MHTDLRHHPPYDQLAAARPHTEPPDLGRTIATHPPHLSSAGPVRPQEPPCAVSAHRRCSPTTAFPR